ncbi:MAG: hypothetical protein JWN48_5622, partial [Myxococcaceae bacterium]|nr:hypothetical protein [Myxococcaceae bacterium]
AVKDLEGAGVDLKQVSIVGKGFHTEEHALGFYTTGDRIKHWSGTGALWGGLWGTLFGSAFFFIPAIGPVIAMGPLVGWIVGALETAAVGGTVGALGGALASIGIPKESVVKYELEVKAGKFIVLAHATADVIERARGALANTGASQINAHIG